MWVDAPVPPALCFQALFRDILAHQVEYSYSESEPRITTMIPLRPDRLDRLSELAKTVSFAGDWAWATARFAAAVQPDEFLFRLDWQSGAPSAFTLYCRFPSEPDDAKFREALTSATPFTWSGPDPSAVASSLGVPGPRGIAFRATSSGSLRTALYFRSDEHAGPTWTERLSTLVAACGYPDTLASSIADDLKQLYSPGPIGVVGVDDGESGMAGGLKFDPSNVPTRTALAFLARAGVPSARIDALQHVAIGLRAEAVTYVGVQYQSAGFSGFRLYFACEPGHVRTPGRPLVAAPRNLRPVRRLPHH